MTQEELEAADAMLQNLESMAQTTANWLRSRVRTRPGKEIVADLEIIANRISQLGEETREVVL